ncbi:chorismate synthase [Promethearchaeum syntrophicum]|uniref:Chorismate synthase n=1 Tax=Promethearchaeum syntrophicum TaxID=2594042 RepID=A0A5B9DF47_9ARCH|nr:chorismate synthase [Candidatus Prometheoarchaeum syntrophicum]QEE17675.1 chorismate synthase [Candidatus Prometheoarchaeum syntrophicum]
MLNRDIFGRLFQIELFGESHSEEIGVIIKGVPKNIKLDFDFIQYELDRRRPGQNDLMSTRDEPDKFNFTNGVKDKTTTGENIRIAIPNINTHSQDYLQFEDIYRPSHVDYPARLRYGSKINLKGGGRFSGRLTAPIVAAGAIAKMILKQYGVNIAGFTSQIGSIKDENHYSIMQIQKKVESSIVRGMNSDLDKRMINLIEDLIKQKDSVGGVVTIQIKNYPPGIGDPWFHSLESDLAAAILSIPSTRGIEFGTGFKAANMLGSEHNDLYILKNGIISTKTNHCGGIIGGISIGTPITFNVPIKPTASIGKTQKTLNFKTKKLTNLKIIGRHDPCIVPRVLIAIEAITAIVLVDHLLISKNQYK